LSKIFITWKILWIFDLWFKISRWMFSKYCFNIKFYVNNRAPDESSQLGPSHESSRVESSRVGKFRTRDLARVRRDLTRWLASSTRKSKPQKSAKTYKKETKRTLVTFLYQNIKKKSLSLFAITSRSPCRKVRWLRS